MFIIHHKYRFFALPIALMFLSCVALFVWGIRPGVDLSGGSLLRIAYIDGTPSATQIQEAVMPLNFGEIRVQASGENEYFLRQRDLSPEEKNALMSALSGTGKVIEVAFTSIGPSIGAELVRKGWWAIGLVSLSIIAFIAFAFRGVSKPVASWKYGIVAIVTLVHDIVLPLGLFSYLGYIRNAEVDALFIVAILTILGISINDTIVVFDRIRENLKRNEDQRTPKIFSNIVGESIMQTIARSINTSITVIIVLVALFWFGPESTQNFALTLIVGMVAGTYSSIFVAAPLLVVLEERQRRASADA